MTTTKTKKTKSEAAPPKDDGMKIIAMQVENIKRVKFARIRPQGNMVEISGANGEGKSSVLDAIDMALTGTTSIPSMPIRKGQRVGQIQIDLGEFKVQRDFTETVNGKDRYITKLTVLGKNREKFPTPQTILDGLMGHISFDPLEFIRMDSKQQFAALQSIAGLDLSAIDAAKKEAYDARRDAGRDLDRSKALLQATAKPAADLPAKPIDTVSLTGKMAEASEHNAAIAEQKHKQTQLRESAQSKEGVIYRANQRIAELEREITNLREQIAEAEAARKDLYGQAEAMAFEEPIDVAAVAAELDQANVTNRKIEQRKVYEALEKQVAAAQTAHEELDAKVKQAEAARQKAIAEAKVPLQELTIGDGEVLYAGIPFSQASNAEQIRVSVALAMASNPKLRVLRIKDGSLLDAKNLELIRTMAAASDYQVWIERVDASDPISVVMEDGEAHGEQTETAPPKPGAQQ